MQETKNGHWKPVKEKGKGLFCVLKHPFVCGYVLVMTFLIGQCLVNDYLMRKYPDRVIEVAETECEICDDRAAREEYYEDAFPVRNF